MNATFAEQAYDHIVTQLLRRDLRPGDLLDRKQIAEDLGISLIPVSDAVQRLTLEGFLTTRRRQGTFVRPPSIEDVRGQFLLREALECQSARLYRGEKLRKTLPRLRKLARAADKAADAGRQLWTEDFAFHQALVALTECDALVSCFERVVNLSLFHQTALISPMQQTTYDRHSELLDDLCDASVEDAESRIREHLRSGKETLFKDQPAIV
jgi:GntR family transcriptional regulator, rspAB operon transcriptional repressor